MSGRTLQSRVARASVGPVPDEPARIEMARADGAESWGVEAAASDPGRFRKVALTIANIESLAILDGERVSTGSNPFSATATFRTACAAMQIERPP